MANAVPIIIYDTQPLWAVPSYYQMQGHVGQSHRMAYTILPNTHKDKVYQSIEKASSTVRNFTELGSRI